MTGHVIHIAERQKQLLRRTKFAVDRKKPGARQKKK
jgi:hypothetical protein